MYIVSLSPTKISLPITIRVVLVPGITNNSLNSMSFHISSPLNDAVILYVPGFKSLGIGIVAVPLIILAQYPVPFISNNTWPVIFSENVTVIFFEPMFKSAVNAFLATMNVVFVELALQISLPS